MRRNARKKFIKLVELVTLNYCSSIYEVIIRNLSWTLDFSKIIDFSDVEQRTLYTFIIESDIHTFLHTLNEYRSANLF